MATNKEPVFANALTSNCTEIDNAAGTALQTLFTAGADGLAVMKLTATTTDTAAVIVVLSVNDGTTENVIGEVTVPAGSGTDGSTPAKNLLDATALPGVFLADGSLPLGGNAILKANAKSAVTAATTLNITGFGGSFSA